MDIRELYRRYAIIEQDNPEPTEEDIDASMKENAELMGSQEAADKSLRQWYGVD